MVSKHISTKYLLVTNRELLPNGCSFSFARRESPSDLLHNGALTVNAALLYTQKWLRR